MPSISLLEIRYSDSTGQTNSSHKPMTAQHKRRDLLKYVAMPLILPSSIFGATAPSNKITVAMLGMGRQAMRPNLDQFLKSPDAQVVAVCDVDPWRLEQAKNKADAFYSKQAGSKVPGVKAYSDFRDILARNDIDAVMISTPDHWHAPMGVMAAQAGKHVCIEKPLTTCVAHGRALCDAVEKAGVVSRTDSEFRGNPLFWRMAELVRNGRIGKVVRIESGVPKELNGNPIGPQKTMPVPDGFDYDMWLGPAFHTPYTERRVHPQHSWSRPGWMRVDDYCNGMISNWGSHLNDIVQWCNGTERTGPVSVKGHGEFSRGLWNTLASFDLEYEYANGVQLRYLIDRPFVRIEGTAGWLQAEYGKPLTASSKEILDSPIDSDEVSFAKTLPDKVDFLRAIKEDRETLEPVEVGHRTVSLCQIGLIAAQLGRPLKWDPTKERFLDDNAADALLSRPVRGAWGL